VETGETSEWGQCCQGFKIENPKFKEVSALSGASSLKQRPLRNADIGLVNWRVLRAVSGANADKLFAVISSKPDQ
jgi:hypothetical protein